MRHPDNRMFWMAVALGAASAVIMAVAAIRYIEKGHYAREFAEAKQLEAQIKEEARIARFEKAAQEICGENAAWDRINEYTIQCFNHRGGKTFIAQVRP